MIEKHQDKLDEINAALDRIELGTYGVCEDTGKKIQKERLEEIPDARFSMKAKKR
jgi:RNA polymerase-binding transcription factor DksA